MEHNARKTLCRFEKEFLEKRLTSRGNASGVLKDTYATRSCDELLEVFALIVVLRESSTNVTYDLFVDESAKKVTCHYLITPTWPY